MRWTTISCFAVLCLGVVVSCGGDDESTREEPAKAGAIKMDGSKLAGCFADSDCKNGLVCYGQTTTSMMATAGFCTDACDPDDPFAKNAICPAISNQMASCSPEGECRLDCTGGGNGDGKCPANMECRDLDASMMNAFRCVYPVGTGRGSKKPWEECNPDRGDADCGAPNVCVAFGSDEAQRGFCSAPCTMDAECMPPAGVTARPLCATQLDACSLDCTDGASCPQGMECVDTTPGNQVSMRCRFVPAGTMQPAGTMPSGNM
jgi:hypothetical protein